MYLTVAHAGKCNAPLTDLLPTYELYTGINQIEQLVATATCPQGLLVVSMNNCTFDIYVH